MQHIIVYSHESSNRLAYTLEWLLGEQLGVDYELVHDVAKLEGLHFFISYGQTFPNALSIPDAGLLWQKDIQQHTINTGSWQNIPTLYAKEGSNYTLPFDLLSAIFFLLSRYEEYYTYTPDRHNRYPATESILYRNGWLRSPLIDEWIQSLRVLLKEHYDIATEERAFSYLPTYDIDIAFSYRYKGWRRALGGFAKDLSAAKMQRLKERALVVGGRKKDPYDSFDWMKHLHDAHHIRPLFFILAALSTTDHDKNIPPSHPRMQRLIQSLARQGTIGVHPSYYTDKSGMLKEKTVLENIIGTDITISRQHYIKIKMPDTYQLLSNDNIAADYSMGYGSHLGFRAGTGQSFVWYNLPLDTISELRIYPFCFMDTTALYEEQLSAAEAFTVLKEMTEKLKQCNSQLITIFHNFSLGSSSEWKGWATAYEQYVQSFSYSSIQVVM